MSPSQKKTAFDGLAAQLWALRSELEHLLPELESEIDRKAIESIMTNLTWATENCTVVGLHQVGEAMDDKMGFRPGDTVA
jgi:hypothetical protein